MFHSQVGQDRFVDALLNGKRNGYFLDIGAYDGVRYSNTLFFEEERGWTGICVEPNPAVFVELMRNRPKARTIQACITQRDGAVDYTINSKLPMYNGVTAHYHPKHLERIKHDARGNVSTNVSVPGVTLNRLLWALSVDEIDYCSLDTEGGELEILQSINFNKYRIGVFTVENNYNDPEIEKYMKMVGYSLVGVLDTDQVFAKE